MSIDAAGPRMKPTTLLDRSPRRSELASQALWRRARAASDATGHPYKDRDGRVTKHKVPSKFESALRDYCVEVLQIPFPE